jgi:tubulin polyglutamylase TTLL6/13
MYGLSQTDNLANDHCFQILGFDVLINDQLEPILLEVNHTPSFATDTPLDKTIKKNLIKETLLLLNVNVSTKKAKIHKKIEFEERRAQRKLTKLTAEEKS